ncbi:hypothetical protein TWF970_008223 [Orbilia oligospora]|nr:hypothetical protein TWF970_008223 [Orbilia oligospora]
MPLASRALEIPMAGTQVQFDTGMIPVQYLMQYPASKLATNPTQYLPQYEGQCSMQHQIQHQMQHRVQQYYDQNNPAQSLALPILMATSAPGLQFSHHQHPQAINKHSLTPLLKKPKLDDIFKTPGAPRNPFAGILDEKPDLEHHQLDPLAIL